MIIAGWLTEVALLGRHAPRRAISLPRFVCPLLKTEIAPCRANMGEYRRWIFNEKFYLCLMLLAAQARKIDPIIPLDFPKTRFFKNVLISDYHRVSVLLVIARSSERLRRHLSLRQNKYEGFFHHHRSQ